MQTVSAYSQLVGKYKGCLLGGAVGDALGWPVEFMSIEDIRKEYGPEGIRDFAETSGGVGAITDDTQMTLFTAEGLVREYGRTRDSRMAPQFASSLYHAYLRWLHTQGEVSRDSGFRSCLNGKLLLVRELHHRRAPGSTCLSALIAGKMGTVSRQVNASKGCGGVMRVAPVGLYCNSLPDAGNEYERSRLAFNIGCEAAAITHGHPLGYLPAGFLSALICLLAAGNCLVKAIPKTLIILAERPEEERLVLSSEISRALEMAQNVKACPESVEKLGGGWVGDEALAISLYCAVVSKGNFAEGTRLAVNHSGDSDSTGAITGSILGAQLGMSAIPCKWLENLELRNVIEKMALDLLEIGTE